MRLMTKMTKSHISPQEQHVNHGHFPTTLRPFATKTTMLTKIICYYLKIVID